MLFIEALGTLLLMLPCKGLSIMLGPFLTVPSFAFRKQGAKCYILRQPSDLEKAHLCLQVDKQQSLL